MKGIRTLEDCRRLEGESVSAWVDRIVRKEWVPVNVPLPENLATPRNPGEELTSIQAHRAALIVVMVRAGLKEPRGA